MDAKELLENLPLRYHDGPDFCTVRDRKGGDFALTVQPELMQLMERAAIEAKATAASIRTRVGQIEKARRNFTADSLYQIERAVAALMQTANDLERVVEPYTSPALAPAVRETP